MLVLDLERHAHRAPSRPSIRIESLADQRPGIAVQVAIGDATVTTAVFTHDRRYLAQHRAVIRTAEGTELGMRVSATVRLTRDRGTRVERPLR